WARLGCAAAAVAVAVAAATAIAAAVEPAWGQIAALLDKKLLLELTGRKNVLIKRKIEVGHVGHRRVV
ncbi:MAG: hypothetical protein EB068_03145, partial [Betaproteobacteria bacterium]|nr:hypothetical protein [Betaproteobacteria bacterium]